MLVNQNNHHKNVQEQAAPWDYLQPGVSYGLDLDPYPVQETALVERQPQPEKPEPNKTKWIRRSVGQKTRQEQLARLADPLAQLVIPLPLPEKRLSAENYSGLEIHGFFGLIDTGQEISRQRVIIVHTPPRVDPMHMLSLRVGEDIDFVYVNTKQRRRGKVYVMWIGRSKYCSPGRAITSLRVGVSGWIEK